MQNVQSVQEITNGLSGNSSKSLASTVSVKTAKSNFQNIMTQQKTVSSNTSKNVTTQLQNQNDSKMDAVDKKADGSATNKVPTKEQTSKNSVTNSKMVDNQDVSTVQKAVTKVEKAIQKTVKDAMDITDEDIANALNSLGMTLMDLLNPSNLQQFVLTTQGISNPMELLTNENLMQTLQNVQDLLSNLDFESLTGMSMEEFMQNVSEDSANGAQFSEQLENAADAANVTQESDQAGNVQMQNAAVTEETTGTEKGSEMQAVQYAGEEQKDASKIENDNASQDVKSSNLEGENAKITVNTGNTKENTGFDENAKDSLNDEMMAEGDQVPVSDQNQAATEDYQNFLAAWTEHVDANQGVDSAQTPISVRQAYAIFSQVTDRIKTSFQKGMTRMDMQLNPESLGKVTISVSDKNGVMTANFFVQSEEAKNALEYQISSLRETLEAKNLKVEAVEVSVSDFSFGEQNFGEQEDTKNFEQGHGKRVPFQGDSDDGENAGSGHETPENRVTGASGGNIDYTA